MCINIKSCDNAVSPVISTILVLMLVLSTVTAILTWGYPYVEKLSLEAEQETVVSEFNQLSTALQDMMIEGNNATRFTTFTFQNGKIGLDTKGNKFSVHFFNHSGYDFVMYNIRDQNCTIKARNLSDSISGVDITYCNNGTESSNSFGGITNKGDTADIPFSPIKGGIKMEFKNSTGDVVATGWIFELGKVYWEASSSVGQFSVEYENGGIIYSTVDQTTFNQGCTIYNEGDKLFMTITLLRGEPRVGSGRQLYQLRTTLTSTTILNQGNFYNFTVNVGDTYSDRWSYYFDTYNFTRLSNSNLRYDSNPVSNEDMVDLTLLGMKVEGKIRLSR